MKDLQKFGDKTIRCLLIQTIEPVINIDDIFTMNGVDIAYVAPFDLLTSLGIPGQFDHSDFLDAVSKIETAAKAAGVPLGGDRANTAVEIDGLIAFGYRTLGEFDISRIKDAAAVFVGIVRSRSAHD